MSSYYGHIKSLVDQGVAEWLPQSWGRTLDEHLTLNYPWSGFHIDWVQIKNATCLNWGKGAALEDVARFLRTTTLNGYPRLAGFYGQDSPVVSFDADWAFWNLDIASAYSQQFFVFGCQAEKVVLADFAEVDPCRNIWAFRQHP